MLSSNLCHWDNKPSCRVLDLHPHSHWVREQRHEPKLGSSSPAERPQTVLRSPLVPSPRTAASKPAGYSSSSPVWARASERWRVWSLGGTFPLWTTPCSGWSAEELDPCTVTRLERPLVRKNTLLFTVTNQSACLMTYQKQVTGSKWHVFEKTHVRLHDTACCDRRLPFWGAWHLESSFCGRASLLVTCISWRVCWCCFLPSRRSSFAFNFFKLVHFWFTFGFFCLSSFRMGSSNYRQKKDLSSQISRHLLRIISPYVSAGLWCQRFPCCRLARRSLKSNRVLGGTPVT